MALKICPNTEQLILYIFTFFLQFFGVPLHSGSSTAHTAAWLTANRFTKYHKMFANFTGTDILRLSRADFIEMCGIGDGLRLFYALHAKWVQLGLVRQ